MRDSGSGIYVSLTSFVNLSLSIGNIPDEWKVAKVIPIYNPENYWPISILPVLSKIMEREVHTQFCKYIDNHNLLSPFQCGFHKKYSCEAVVNYFTDTIRKNTNSGLLTGAVFIDIKKVFDTVNHEYLLKKLFKYGLTDIEHNIWFLSEEEPTLETLDLAIRNRQFNNLFIFRFVSLHCLRSTLYVY